MIYEIISLLYRRFSLSCIDISISIFMISIFHMFFYFYRKFLYLKFSLYMIMTLNVALKLNVSWLILVTSTRSSRYIPLYFKACLVCLSVNYLRSLSLFFYSSWLLPSVRMRSQHDQKIFPTSLLFHLIIFINVLYSFLHLKPKILLLLYYIQCF